MVNFIEFPVFDGVSGDLKQWILWLEEFFVRERFTAMEKMNLAQSLLEGEAEAWFYSIQKTLIFYSWKELKRKLLLRFGDFDDPDRIRLIAKLDRFLQEIRDETRIQRMKTTSIPVKDTIRETITVVEETSEVVDGNLAERASEKKLVSPYQVPVSSLEPGLSFSTESLVVSEARPSDIVSNNRVQSQSGLDCVKNKTNAYQVFDKTSPHTERLKSKTKRKLSLSPKTWMFKFKNKNLQRQYSCSRAKCGYKWKEHNSRYGRRMRQTHMSRLLCNLQVRHDPKDWGQLILDALKSHMRHKWKSKHLLAVFDLQNSPAYALDVVNTTSKAWGNQQTFTSKPVASVHSLSFEVGTEETMSSGLSQNRQVWEPGGVLSDHVLVDIVEAGSKGLAYDGCVILGMNCAGFGRSKTELLATGQQMQRTDLFSELLKDSSNGGAESFPILNVVTEHSFFWLQNTSENYLLVSEFEKKKQMLGYKTRMFKYKSRFPEISLTDTKFLCEKVQRVSCLSLAAQFNSLEIIQAVLEQIIQGETSTKIIDNAASSSGSHAKSLLIEMGFCPTLVQKAIGENGEDLEVLLEILTKSTVTEEPSFHGLREPKSGPDIESETDSRRMTLLTMQFPENLVDLALDRLGKDTPNWERMSIWHRWRRKDCTRPSSCVLPLQFSFFKLEDKLVLRGESIDTIGDVAS